MGKEVTYLYALDDIKRFLNGTANSGYSLQNFGTINADLVQ